MKKMLLTAAVLVLAACGEKKAEEAPAMDTSAMNQAPADTGMAPSAMPADTGMAQPDTTMARDSAQH